MPPQEHQAIYNLNLREAAPEANFPRFTHLPQEIRREIWRNSLQGHRLIRVFLEPDSTHSHPEVSSCYRASVYGHRVYSKLLRVSSEARQTALSFYNIHIPCKLLGRAESPHLSPIYLNAAYDFLHITPSGPARETFVGFLSDLRKHDVRGVGLLNLAIGLNDLKSCDLLDLRPAHLEAPEQKVLVETLSQLREVFWVTTPTIGRANAGALGSVRGIGIRFNAAFPIMTGVPRFERLPKDPRPVDEDLRRLVCGGPDPRELIRAWYRLLEIWDIRHPDPVQYRFLLSLSSAQFPDQGPIMSLEDARARLQKESECWKKKLDTLQRFHKGRTFKWEPSATVGAAFGFWLFPVDTDTKTPLGLSEDVEDKYNQILDVRSHWPELALSDLQ
ncbi:hypothetical protein ACRE_025810 [Hapsidospora chrysogenum ATCC 11550]|uniref:2EXR domain-containing protein n=1 Tax=Hapsidospora chrysogenum (strain ATCC 11550 / CBS 779.69 / DSM 880 / IAM 14645 / JCM 23072 / IMI 49137) TaxID=857340 RepID=A0A086TAV7_HAPC1|nr:hypothetical protein ACRE_025810 [Hapsidospora chrysogenum ATCC 11550]